MARAAAITAATGLLSGVLLVQWMPRLPPHWCLGLLLLVAAPLAWRFPRGRWLAYVLSGIVWAAWRGGMSMDARLPRALEGSDVVVVGAISDLPQIRSDATSFTLRVEQASLDGEPVALHGRISVSWYNNAPLVRPCTRWQLLLRLKRPRGLLNPGGADSERSALERGISATGYVREDPDNAQLAACRGAWMGCAMRFRAALWRACVIRTTQPCCGH